MDKNHLKTSKKGVVTVVDCLIPWAAGPGYRGIVWLLQLPPERNEVWTLNWALKHRVQELGSATHIGSSGKGCVGFCPPGRDGSCWRQSHFFVFVLLRGQSTGFSFIATHFGIRWREGDVDWSHLRRVWVGGIGESHGEALLGSLRQVIPRYFSSHFSWEDQVLPWGVNLEKNNYPTL